MKRILIIAFVCLGMLGSTLSCSGEEKATTADTKKAEARTAPAKAQEAAPQPAKKKNRPAAKVEEAAPKDAASVERDKMTNADCFPETVPDTVHNTAKLCLGLAKSAPDMLFTMKDYEGMPEECKPIVLPKCR